MYFDDFLTRLKKGDDPRMVLLFGDSDGVINEGYQCLKDHFHKTKPGGTLQVFEGGENTLSDFLAAAQTQSLFASAQLLVLKHAEKTLGGRSEEALQQLKDYFSSPNPDSLLVLLAPGMRKTVKAVTTAEKLGWAVQCSDMPEWKLSGWVRQRAQQEGLQLTEEGAQILIQKVGNDLAYLQRAMEQLSTYIYPRKAATAEEVRELPTPGMESEVFPFLDAVGMRQTEKALALMARLEDGVDTGTLMLLYGRIRELLMVACGRAKGWGQTQLTENLGLHPFRLKNLWDQAGLFTVEELKEAMTDLIHVQAGVVTGRLGKTVPAVLLEWFVLKTGKKRVAAKAATR
ncbi:MAG TPA: DNA polymerase III subunit delta [bacterium]|nr:DNA polymerase III subunit delta [bacterium]